MLGLQIDSLDLRFRAPDADEQMNMLANQVWHFVKFVPLVYGIAAVMITRRYCAQLKDQYSEFSTTEPGWLNVLTIGFLLSWGMTLVVHTIAQHSNPQISDAMGIADNYVTFILMNALFTYSMVYAHKLLTTRHEPSKEKHEEKVTDSAIAKVHYGMENEKLFLKQNLNIEEFSKRIDLPVKEVSAVINKHYGTNFFEFMNSYRVEEAKRLLSDPQHAEMTVLDVLLQSGFNSKSAFHRFFNRLVGVSPTEFRKHGLPEGSLKKAEHE
jgi:AraC-like DNA-binding protein